MAQPEQGVPNQGNSSLSNADNALNAAGGMLSAAARSTRGERYERLTTDWRARGQLYSAPASNVETFGPAARFVGRVGVATTLAVAADRWSSDGPKDGTFAIIDAAVTTGLARYPNVYTVGGAAVYNLVGGSKNLEPIYTPRALLEMREQASLQCAFAF